MVVSDVNIEGRPLNLNIRDVPTTTHNGVFRADAWIFPFLNVYGLLGETAGVTRPEVVFPNAEFWETDVQYDRFSYGGGMTLAGGRKAFFLTLDANYADRLQRERPDWSYLEKENSVPLSPTGPQLAV